MIHLLSARQTTCKPLREPSRRDPRPRTAWRYARTCAIAVAMLVTAPLVTAGKHDIPQLIGLWQGNAPHAERLTITHQDGRKVAGVWTAIDDQGLTQAFVARGTLTADYLELSLYPLARANAASGDKAQPETTGRDHACNTLSTGPASQAEGSGIVCVDDQKANTARAVGRLSFVLGECSAQGVADYFASAFGADARASDKRPRDAVASSDIATLKRTTTAGCSER